MEARNVTGLGVRFELVAHRRYAVYTPDAAKQWRDLALQNRAAERHDAVPCRDVHGCRVTHDSTEARADAGLEDGVVGRHRRHGRTKRGGRPGYAIVKIASRDGRRVARLVPGVHELVRDERAAVTATHGVEVVHRCSTNAGSDEHSESIIHDTLSQWFWRSATRVGSELNCLSRLSLLCGARFVPDRTGPRTWASFRHRRAHDPDHRAARHATCTLPKPMRAKAKRTDRIHRVTSRTVRAGKKAAVVGAYSPRARPGTPIAVPVTWQQVATGIAPNAFTIDSPP